MRVQLAMYKGKGYIGNWFIREWTDSEYSHCELVVDGVCYSSSMMDGGVRAKVIDLNNGKWDLIDLPWVNGEDVLAYFAATDHMRYGWASLFTAQMFNLNRGIRNTKFCSQWCAVAMGLPNPLSYSPRTLMDIALYINHMLSSHRDLPPCQFSLS